MNVSMSLVDVGIMKSIGPDKAKLENSLKLFGPGYHYIVTGYPPFIKNFVDTTELNLKKYNMDLVVGGEAMSEGLRTYLLQFFNTVRSSYGASDLEINIGAETDLAIDLRRKLLTNEPACQALFGKSQPPMIFQYDPVDYIVETNQDDELIFTITRFHNAAPKIRYNLHDIGAVITFKDMMERLRPFGIACDGDYARSHFPFLCVYGRGDLTVPFYGAKIFTSDIEKIINEDELLIKAVNSFQMRSYDDQKLDRKLKISFEKTADSSVKMHTAWLKQVIYDGLIANNQDFREVTKMFTPDSIIVEVFEYGEGPFAGRDIRLKNKYIQA
jgi:phenylacetate-CoA ligase